MPPLQVHTSHLEQIFSNLLSNAIKYAGESRGRIEVWGETQGERTTLFVRDHGPGLPRDQHDKVFELYYRSNPDATKHGTGIGLATIKKIADFYQGAAWVEDTPGGGCTFCVALPASPCDHDPPTA